MEIKVKGTEPLWVALWVKPQTKKKLKVMCAKEGKTFDQKIKELLAAQINNK